MANKEQENPFQDDELEPEQQTTNSEVFDLNKLSDQAIGNKVKYVSEPLDGKEVVIEKAELITANKNEELITAMNDKTKKYYKCKFKE